MLVVERRQGQFGLEDRFNDLRIVLVSLGDARWADCRVVNSEVEVEELRHILSKGAFIVFFTDEIIRVFDRVLQKREGDPMIEHLHRRFVWVAFAGRVNAVDEALVQAVKDEPDS